jgi:hypothetical protein
MIKLAQGMKKTGQIGIEKGDYMNSANAGNGLLIKET